MNCTGKFTIFVKTFEAEDKTIKKFYSATLSTKIGDKKYHKYFDVIFKKDDVVSQNFRAGNYYNVEVKESFWSIKPKRGIEELYLVILKYDVAEVGTVQAKAEVTKTEVK